MQAIKNELVGAKGKLYARQCDVSKPESIKETFDWIEQEFGGLNILVNNAGVSRYVN